MKNTHTHDAAVWWFSHTWGVCYRGHLEWKMLLKP